LLLAETLQQAKRTGEAEAVLSKSLSDRPNSSVLMRLVQLFRTTKNARAI
jgi:hypothetical protein